MLNLYDELLKVTRALKAAGVDHALCGGLALALYDRPRATMSIDLLIPDGQIKAACATAKSLGFTIRALDMNFAKGEVRIVRVVKLDRDSGDPLVLDMIRVTPGLEGVWEGREVIEWEGAPMDVVSRGGLIEMKRLRSSPQDLVDIQTLEATDE